jgi:glutamate-1-semialdehyde 2,1-aminomutase
MKKNSGVKLWQRAKEIIPGGNMLLSKRSEQFLPGIWPSYFKKSAGCHVWDLDGNKYTDVSIMGIGTNILGYSHPEVDCIVENVVKQGNMSTFNCPEEVYLAEKLIEMHTWADMVKYARSGGEANSIAVRISRAASGKDNVAICGYHGWHDWYLAANLGSSSELDEHLLPGLPTLGVPRNLDKTIFPFNYNDIQELEKIVATQNIGTIKMEVSRSQGPKDNFLEKVRSLATKNNIVLIFDECTSGFREAFGGLHLNYGVEPDLAVFGKAIGNGYALTAVIGKRDVMEYAQNSFISSTFWTERIGPAASLKTLEVMNNIKSWKTITAIGNDIKRNWSTLFNSYGIDIEISGLPALATFNIPGPNALAYKTLVTQEMLKEGFLAGNTIYVCTEHKQIILDEYFSKLESVVKLISECENGRSITSLLEGPICHTGFKRLN